MRDTARVECALLMFTSPDRAAAIAGDLTEEREGRGAAWFWLNVAGTMLALWRRSVADAPLVVLMLVIAGAVLLLGPVLAGVAAVNVFPHRLNSPVNWIPVSFFWWGGALGVGVSLVTMAPRRGMAACTTLAAAGEALLIAFAVSVIAAERSSMHMIVFYTAGVMVPAPLLIGAALARRRHTSGAMAGRQ